MRIDAGEPERDESCARYEVQAAGCLFADDQHGGGAVADLRRVAGRHLPVGQKGRLEGGQCLGRGVASGRLVDVEDDADVRIRQLDGHHFALEASLVDRAQRAPVRLERERVQLLAGKVPLVRDHLGGDPLWDDLPPFEQLVRQVAPARAHRHARHHLGPGGDDDVELAGPDRGRGVEVPLHRRAALPVDGGATHGLRPTRDERDHPPHVPALLADLRDAAELDVLDLGRVEVLALDERIQDLAGELVAANRRERAVPLADWRADRIDDQCVRFPGRHAGLD